MPTPFRLFAACLLACSCGTAAAQAPTPFVVSLDGPSDGTGGFMVFVTKPATGIARSKHNLPTGATFAELTDNSGRTVWVFINPKPGRYEFSLSVQLPTVASKENPTGLDPFAEDSLVVVVGGAPPVVIKPDDPTKPDAPPSVDPATKATAATYVYEKDQGGVPSAVMYGLNRVNRENKIIATVFEQDSTDGTGDTPEQYKAAVTAAKAAGLPCLVVLAGSTVLRTVKAPTTEAAVMEAVK